VLETEENKKNKLAVENINKNKKLLGCYLEIKLE